MRRRLASRVPCFRLWRSCRRPRCARRLLPTRRLPRLPRHRPQLPTLAMRSRLPGPPPLLPLPPQPQQLMPGKRMEPHLPPPRRSPWRFEPSFMESRSRTARDRSHAPLSGRSGNPLTSVRGRMSEDAQTHAMPGGHRAGSPKRRQLSNFVPSQWICSVAMRRATMTSKVPLSTCNLGPHQGPPPPCQTRRRS